MKHIKYFSEINESKEKYIKSDKATIKAGSILKRFEL
jgi:hypothetical protein